MMTPRFTIHQATNGIWYARCNFAPNAKGTGDSSIEALGDLLERLAQLPAPSVVSNP